ncbi:hypothetical protein PG996_011951 [Apiospora saccharicola]|uniref:dUTPase-like domain-containing protein n=1 Tax=Apiospora saccharicola TaxID=335842 RepID=A0ABR1U169_9PEZI
MPVVVTRNLHVGLKLVNSAPFTAADVVLDPAYSSIAVASDVTFHLGPPLAVLLQSDAIADLAIPGLPPGTALLRSQTVAIPEPMRGRGGPQSRGKPGFQGVTRRTGPPCTPTFAMTDQKSQAVKGDALGRLIPLPGTGAVGLHRAEECAGCRHERSRGAPGKTGDETSERLQREHGQKGWLAAWDAMEEPAAAGRRQDEAPEEDT